MSRVLNSKDSLLILLLAFIAALGIMGCKPDPVSPIPDPANYKDEIAFPDGADYGEFFPEHVAGDCQFGSLLEMHGPIVNVQANLRVDASKTELWLTCSMKAIETEADWTKAEGSWETLLYTSPAGWYISTIASAPTAIAEYTDTNLFWDKIETSMCDFNIMGNTMLNDVCNTIGDRDATRMKIHLNPISIVLCDVKR